MCHTVFRRCEVPPRLTNKALTLLLCGQLLNRVLFYLGLAHYIQSVALCRYGAGLLLVCGGYYTVCEPLSHQAAEPAEAAGRESALAVTCRWLEHYAAMLAGGDGKVLIPAVGSMILVDLILGADCAIAKIEEIDATYLNLSSSTLALFGLKAAYAIFANAADRLVYIQYGMGAVLVFIGLELLLMSWVDIGSFASIAACVGIIAACAMASLCFGPPPSGKSAGES